MGGKERREIGKVHELARGETYKKRLIQTDVFQGHIFSARGLLVMEKQGLSCVSVCIHTLWSVCVVVWYVW